MTRYPWFSFGVLAVALMNNAGCKTQNRVLGPLPGPYHLDYCDAPSPVVPTYAAPIATAQTAANQSTAQTSHPWVPQTGISDRWTCIIIHHSDSEIGSLSDIDTWHHQQGWEHGCGYHFVIGNGSRSEDGQVEVSKRWTQQLHGAHTRLSEEYANRKHVDFQHYNQHGIGIVLVGDFANRAPSARQTAALNDVVRFLTEQCGIDAAHVHTHGEVDQTQCPGRKLDIDAVRRTIRMLEPLSGQIGQAAR